MGAKRPSSRAGASAIRAAPQVDPASADDWLSWLALLGDGLRVRLLRLLEREELGVGEVARVVQLPQSTVSRHLKTLLDAGWIARRVEGTASLYRLAAELPRAAQELWALTRRRFDATPAVSNDDHRLVMVLAERKADTEAFFGRIGGEWSTLRDELFGGHFNDEALLGLIEPDLVVADLGCGTGEVAERLAPLVARVIAVDREPSMLTAAKRRLAAHTNVEFRRGELHALPLEDAEADAAVISLVLHHVDDPAVALADVLRVVRPGGRILLIDMIAHDRESWRHTMGHRHLGFTDAAIEGWGAVRRGGDALRLRRLRRLRPDPEGKGPGLFAALFVRERVTG